MGNLTILAVKAAVKPGRYQDGRGLMLLVKPSGARSWVLRTQVDGKRRDFGLGALADVGLADAREKADTFRKQFKSGIDPVEAKRAEKAALATIPTFEQAAAAMHAEQRSTWRNDKHRAQWLMSLRTYAVPALGKSRVDRIDGPMIRDMLLPIWLEKPETARRVRQRVGAVLDWCHAKGLRQTEAPMRSISKGLPRQPKRDRHFSAMPYSDIPALMASLAEADASGRLALQFLILTAVRSGEVRSAQWEQIDFEAATWTIPAERTKAHKAHTVPLSESALCVLGRAKALRTGRAAEPIFPGLHGKVMSDMTLAKALKTAGAGAFTVHGFRSGFRDWAAEMTGTPGDVVEAALAHTIANRVEAAYRRTNYLEKRRPLMDAWAQYLSAATANVVPIRSASQAR
jgi:integrase